MAFAFRLFGLVMVKATPNGVAFYFNLHPRASLQLVDNSLQHWITIRCNFRNCSKVFTVLL